MNALKGGWFTEVCAFWPGSCVSYEVQKVLYKGRTEFQDVLILQTKYHGRALVLDNIIQYMESDAFGYNEMLAFLPLCSHPQPIKVLIVGGGGGGAALQALKHPDVEEVHLVGIDGMVLDACKKFFPETAAVLNNPKVSVFTEDVYEFLKRREDQYDVIITDSSEPLGPAEGSDRQDDSKEYFVLKKNALQYGGVISMQAGSVWTASNYARTHYTPAYTLNFCRDIFGNAAYASVNVPSFESGQIGIVVASTNLEVDLTRPLNELQESFLEKNDFHYYSPSVHFAAFIMPRRFEKLLGLNSTETPRRSDEQPSSIRSESPEHPPHATSDNEEV